MPLKINIFIIFAQINAHSVRFWKCLWSSGGSYQSTCIGRQLSCYLAWILEIITMRNFTGKSFKISPKCYEVILVLQWLQIEWKNTRGPGTGIPVVAKSVLRLTPRGFPCPSLVAMLTVWSRNTSFPWEMSQLQKSLNCSISACLELIKKLFSTSLGNDLLSH